MLIATASFVVMLALLDRAVRRGRTELLILQTRHTLFSLRDLLRVSAINGAVDPKNWMFDYLDSTLTRAAAAAGRLTLYEIAAVLVAQPEALMNNASYRKLEAELSKPENSRYRAIVDGYQSCMSQFLRKRHPGFFFFFAMLGKAVGRKHSDQCSEEDTLKQAVSADPKISTLSVYADRYDAHCPASV